MRITVRHLEAFRAFAQSGSFSTAAQRLHVAQPSLSATIKNLELLCGAKLFDRQGRRISLTPIGQELLQLSQRVLVEFERSIRDLEDFVASRRGQVRLAALPAVYATVLPPVLSQYREQFPNIELTLRDLSAGEALSSLRAGRVDMALVTLVEPQDDLQSVPLCEHALVLMMQPEDPLAQLAPVDIDWSEALAGPLVTVNPGSHMGRLCEAVLAEHGLRISDAQRVENLLTAMGLVKAGVARAVVSNLSVQGVAAAGYVYRRLANPLVTREIALVTRRGYSLPPAAQCMAEMIVSATGDLRR